MGCNGNPSCRCMKMAGLDVLASWAEMKRNGSFIIKYRLRMYGDHCRVLEFVPTPQCFSVLVKPLCENNWLLFELIMGRTQCEHKERKLKPQRNTDESSKVLHVVFLLFFSCYFLTLFFFYISNLQSSWVLGFLYED